MAEPVDQLPPAAPPTPLPGPSAPAQGPTTTGEQAQPPPPTGGASPMGNWIALGVLVAVVLLFAYALVRKRAQRRREMATPPGARQLEAKKERIEPVEPGVPVPAPPRRAPEKPAVVSEAQLAAERAAADARKAEDAARAAQVEAKRKIEEARAAEDASAARQAAEEARVAAQQAREAAEQAKAAAEEQARRAREEEEERKRAEYRAKREHEAEERERRRVEAEEARRRAEEEARLKAAEEEARRLAEEQERRRKIEAEAGKTLAEGLAKTRGGFVASLNSFLGRTKVIDESILAELEEVLFSADIGVKTATSLLDFAREKVRAKDLSDPEKLKDAIRDQVAKIVDVRDGAFDFGSHKPYVLMVIGVNGSGKTTTIGKLAAKLTAQGKKVLLAAGDTFRAAATEQLEIWGQRAQAPVVKGKEGSDPGAVIFDALKKGQAEGYDVVICDTAGRLHTKAPLMEELKRVKRVMDKALPGSPHDTLLVLDSTNGQNAIAQAREFHNALGANGIVLTKLDGTAKGGVIIGICDELKLPVRYVGIGEAVGDLKPFNPKEFVEALFD